MQTPFLIQFAESARHNPRTIVLPEGLDDRILKASIHCVAHGLAKPVLIGNINLVKELAFNNSLSLDGISIVDPSNDSRSEAYANTLLDLRKAKGLTEDQANEMIQQPLVFANCMVRAGDADACVAGAQHSTSDVVRAALQIIGVASGVKLVSSFFIMVTKHSDEPILFADCALNIAPDPAQLADIAISSAESAFNLLGFVPRIAMLSFSTNASATHPQVDKVRDAVALIKAAKPDLNVIGDIQFDAAFNAQTLKAKWPDTTFTAPANIFIFPSLESGNIAYKIAERLGGALPVGPILQGLNKPVNDLSRGSDVEAIINTIIVTANQVL